MPSLNLVVLAGNLTRDPELRYTASGTAVANYGMAVNRKWKSKSGEQRESVLFVEVTSWGRQAEIVCEYTRKGDPLMIQGHLKLDQWINKKTGENRQKILVETDNIQLIGSRGSRENRRDEKRETRRTPTEEPGVDDLPNDEDVPF